jgi:hypothetical protein
MTPAEMPAWLLALVTRGSPEDAAPVAEQAPTPPAVLANERAARALAAMRRLRADDLKDGSRRLFAAAAIAVRFDLDSTGALATIREYLRGAPTPRKYSDADILKRLHDAERTCTRGAALNNGQARRAAAPSTTTPNTPPPEPFRPFPVDALPGLCASLSKAWRGRRTRTQATPRWRRWWWSRAASGIASRYS